MASSGTNTYFEDEIQPGLIAYEPQSDREGYWAIYHSSTSPSELPSSPSTNKASQNRFFVWVAITRPKLNPIQRYTCPMIGCEHQFESLEPMLQHLPLCSRLPDGLYYCVESGRNEKVGKCSTRGCQELRGRFLTAVNSGLQSVKRRFSGRSSKTQHRTESSFEQSPIIPREALEIDSNWNPTFGASELPHNGNALLEMDALNFMPSELSAITVGHDGTTRVSSKLDLEVNAENTSRYNNYQSALVETNNDLPGPPAYTSQWESLSSEMDTQDDWIYGAENPLGAQFGPSELCSGDENLWMRASASQQTSYFSTSTQTYSRSQSNGAESNVNAANFHPVQDTFQSFQIPDHTSQISNKIFKEDTVVPEPLTSSRQLPNEFPYVMHLQSRTETSSSSSSNTTESASAFSNAASMSTRDSSMSSIDMTNIALEDNQYVPTPFFENQPNMLFDEPESMDDELELIPPLALRAKDRHYQTVHRPNVRRVDINEVSYDDYIQPGSYLLNISTAQYEPSSPKQTPGHEMLSTFETTATLTTRDSITFETPPVVPSPSIRPGTSRRTSCQHCKREQRNLSNIPRHERACKMNPNRPKDKPYRCNYPRCTSAFTRPDNLQVHQKSQKHCGSLDLHGRFTQTPISPEMNMALDERERLMMVERAEKMTRF